MGKGGIIRTIKQPLARWLVLIRIRPISNERCRENEVDYERHLLKDLYPRKGIKI